MQPPPSPTYSAPSSGYPYNAPSYSQPSYGKQSYGQCGYYGQPKYTVEEKKKKKKKKKKKNKSGGMGIFECAIKFVSFLLGSFFLVALLNCTFTEQFNQEMSLTKEIPSGLFNAMFDFFGCWQKDVAYTKTFVFSGMFITLHICTHVPTVVYCREAASTAARGLAGDRSWPETETGTADRGAEERGGRRCLLHLL
ncbi:unnamed protein product [Fraxinus pennsylvanica]|uniref:Uncharacterized protein n=1 Tax=Fraxinus pennsylvanica TaxID=56036 RepID=A0AAD1ZG29_9LAMI|nr:unnamed protein product [Fraxinus pennsylvanica]